VRVFCTVRSRRVKRLKVSRLIALPTLSLLVASATGLCAASHAEMNRDVHTALNHLYSISPAARRAGESAKAVLVFPNIVKATSNIEGRHGYGTLFARGKAIGYYKFIAASYSVPKRGEEFSYALFFMSDDDLAQLRRSRGWEIPANPSGVVMKENQRRSEQAATSTSVNSNQAVTIASSAATIVGHTSEVSHRPAMNDQQDAAPRPNDLMLGPTYGGFASMPDASMLRPPTRTPRTGVYAFAFSERGLIPGLSFVGTKITPIKKTEKP
jgi:lipid-binding SYLF domain-containing protein